MSKKFAWRYDDVCVCVRVSNWKPTDTLIVLFPTNEILISLASASVMPRAKHSVPTHIFIIIILLIIICIIRLHPTCGCFFFSFSVQTSHVYHQTDGTRSAVLFTWSLAMPNQNSTSAEWFL